MAKKKDRDFYFPPSFEKHKLDFKSSPSVGDVVIVVDNNKQPHLGEVRDIFVQKDPKTKRDDVFVRIAVVFIDQKTGKTYNNFYIRRIDDVPVVFQQKYFKQK